MPCPTPRCLVRHHHTHLDGSHDGSQESAAPADGCSVHCEELVEGSFTSGGVRYDGQRAVLEVRLSCFFSRVELYSQQGAYSQARHGAWG